MGTFRSSGHSTIIMVQPRDSLHSKDRNEAVVRSARTRVEELGLGSLESEIVYRRQAEPAYNAEVVPEENNEKWRVQAGAR